MNHKFRFFSLGLCIVLIVMGVLYYMNERSYRESFHQKFGSQSALSMKAPIATPTESAATQIPTPSPSPGLVEMSEIAREKRAVIDQKWQEALKMLALSAKKCDAALIQVLPDNSLIDVQDPFYDNPDAVIAKYSDVLQEVMTIENALHATELFNEAVLNVESIPLEKLIEMEGAFDICRSQRALIFVETVFEAFSKKMWASLKHRALMGQTLGYLQYRLEFYPATAQNITFALNLLLGLSVQGLLPKELQTELDDLYDKVIESQDLSRELPKMDRSQAVKRELYRENYANNRYISGELLELIKRLGQRY